MSGLILNPYLFATVADDPVGYVTDWSNGLTSTAWWYTTGTTGDGKAFTTAFRFRYLGAADFTQWLGNWFGYNMLWLMSSGAEYFRVRSENSSGEGPDMNTSLRFQADDIITFLGSVDFANQSSDNCKIMWRRNRGGTITSETLTAKHTSNSTVTGTKNFLGYDSSNRNFDLMGPIGVWPEYRDVTQTSNQDIFFNANGSWKDLGADGTASSTLATPLIWTRGNKAAQYNTPSNGGSISSGSIGKSGYTITDL